MGSGRWDAGTYTRSTTSKVEDHGTPFVYSKTAHATGTFVVHESLDPKLVAGPTSPFAGKVMRESRDSAEHPETTPIAVFFDVTGSMGHLPTVLQTKFPKLYGLLLAKGYVEHPQIMFGAVGDARSGDRVPLQVGQFESDNRADENLENLVLEGGGGGGNHESYELAAYFVANHTTTDAWEKRGKKGYMFIVGDERTYSHVSRTEVARLIGDTIQEDIPTKTVFAQLEEQWEVYFLFANESHYTVERVVNTAASEPDALAWRDVLGQNALILDKAEGVCEAIALTIGIGEGSIDLDTGLDDLTDAGTDVSVTEATGRALATVGGGGALSTTGDTDGDLEAGDGAGADRL